MIENRVLELAQNSQGMEIPKPEAKEAFRIKGLGTRRGETALIYTIPSHTGKKPYQKGITISEFEKAYLELKKSGCLTKAWFNRQLPACAKEGSCNFTSLGGIFEMLGFAKYTGRGEYQYQVRS